jgi:hypothetical protein
MTVIIRASGNIGPFKAVETMQDRLRCDGVDYPFTVLGAYTLSNDDSLAPTPAPSPEPVPSEVSNAQAREALIRSGISISSVDAALAAITDPVEREVAVTQWEYRSTIRRDAELVVSMAGAMNLTPAQVDDLFRLAATL